jgi:hypothetical protein
MVCMTTGHGTSLMAPSNSMNTMTRPLRTRPSKRVGGEAAAVSASVVMVGSVWDW